MIRAALFCGLVLSLTGAATAQDKKDAPKELAPFQGTWKVVKAEQSGKVVEGAKLQFTFDGTKVAFVQGEKDSGTGSFTLDAKKSPTEIDLVSEQGVKSPGIYKFEKDGQQLVICFVKGGDKRPQAFDSADLPDAVVLTLEKVKK